MLAYLCCMVLITIVIEIAKPTLLTSTGTLKLLYNLIWVLHCNILITGHVTFSCSLLQSSTQHCWCYLVNYIVLDHSFKKKSLHMSLKWQCGRGSLKSHLEDTTNSTAIINKGFPMQHMNTPERSEHQNIWRWGNQGEEVKKQEESAKTGASGYSPGLNCSPGEERRYTAESCGPRREEWDSSRCAFSEPKHSCMRDQHIPQLNSPLRAETLGQRLNRSNQKPSPPSLPGQKQRHKAW